MNLLTIKLSFNQKRFLFSASFLALMSLSQHPGILTYLFTIFALIIQFIVWKSVSTFEPHSTKDVHFSLVIFTLFILPFSIFFNFSIIQLLWDVFIWSHSTHPYSVIPTDPLIAKAQSALLFDYLPNKFELSTTPAPLLIGLKPIFILYKKIGLFGTLIISKLVLASIFALLVDYAIPNKFKLFWLFNPLIWILAISQADFSLLGFISFGFGLYFYQQTEFQNAFFIWGFTALFGFEYVLLILFITSLDKKFNYIFYSLFSSFIWVILIWDNQAIYSYFFQSSLQHSLVYKFFPSLVSYNFYLIFLFYISLAIAVILITYLLKQKSTIENSDQTISYFEWILNRKKYLLLFSSIALSLLFYQSFHFTFIWALFATLFASQYYYLKQSEPIQN